MRDPLRDAVVKALPRHAFQFERAFEGFDLRALVEDAGDDFSDLPIGVGQQRVGVARALRRSPAGKGSALWLSRSARLADLLAGVCVANPARLTFFKAGACAGVGAATAAFGSAVFFFWWKNHAPRAWHAGRGQCAPSAFECESERAPCERSLGCVRAAPWPRAAGPWPGATPRCRVRAEVSACASAAWRVSAASCPVRGGRCPVQAAPRRVRLHPCPV